MIHTHSNEKVRVSECDERERKREGESQEVRIKMRIHYNKHIKMLHSKLKKDFVLILTPSLLIPMLSKIFPFYLRRLLY